MSASYISHILIGQRQGEAPITSGLLEEANGAFLRRKARTGVVESPKFDWGWQVRARSRSVACVLDDLPSKYQLSYYLGEIVRNDTWAENEMKMLWHRLDEAGLNDGTPLSRDFGKVIPQVRKLLGQHAVAPEFRQIALDVIDSTHRAHLQRRELVHEILVQPPWEGEKVRGALGVARTYSMSEIAECAEALQRCTWRLRGVWIIAPAWIGGVRDTIEGRDDLISWTRVAMGHIAENSNRVVGTLGPCPEPLGGY